MRRKRSYGNPSVCGQCMGIIDINEVLFAIKAGIEYRHPCGKRLVMAK